MNVRGAVEVRSVDRAAVVGGSALGAVILAGCAAAAGGDPPYGYVRLALVALAGAAAFVLDEPAAAAVDAAPRTRRRRTATRAFAVLLPCTVWTGGVLALAARNAVIPTGALLIEGVGVLVLAVALAAVLRLAGRNEPGEVVASILGAAILAALIFPPTSVPLFPAEARWAASTALWGSVAVVATAVVVVTSRDRFRLGRRHGAHLTSTAHRRS